jgi:hypothetical protein
VPLKRDSFILLFDSDIIISCFIVFSYFYCHFLRVPLDEPVGSEGDALIGQASSFA